MATTPKNLIYQTSTTTGASDFTLIANTSGEIDFSNATYGFGTGAPTNVFTYFISHRTLVEWEIGTGHMSAAQTMVRDTVTFSSNANAAVSFSAGTKDVTSDVPASEYVQATNNLSDVNSAVVSRKNLLPDSLGYPLNYSLAASAGSSALTITLNGVNGSAPSATNPVSMAFRNATAATGDSTVLNVTAATTLVISSGSTLGVVSSTAFRLWVVGFNDGGTFRLGVINCAAFTANTSWTIYTLNESDLVTSIAEGGAGAADSAGVFYTGTAVTTKAYRILGYLEWSLTGLTAGTWTTTQLLEIQLMGPGVHKPGEVIQATSLTTATETSTTSQTPQSCTGLSKAFTLTSAANLLRSKLSGNSINGGSNFATLVIIAAAGTNIGQQISCYVSAGGAIISFGGIDQLSKPNSISSITYDARVSVSAASPAGNFPETTAGGYGVLELQETMA